MEVQVQASIMIVDDDSDVRLLLEDAMRAAGFNCVSADCGQQALEMLINRLRKTQTNLEFLHVISRTTPSSE